MRAVHALADSTLWRHHGDMNATRDGDTFTLTGAGWSDTYPIDDFGKWLAFYRRMRDEFPKANGAYDETVVELERLAVVSLPD